IFLTSVERNMERHVMVKRDGAWKVFSSWQLYGCVVAMARTLKQWGIQKGDRVAILSENRPEWMIVDFACVCSGIAGVPIYSTLTAEQSLYLLQNSGARVLCLSTVEQLRKIQPILPQTKVEKVVIMDDLAEVNVIPIWNLLDGASTNRDAEFDAMARAIQ